jgi:hypothetical protein
VEELGVTDKFYEAVPPLQPDENTKGFTTIHFPKMRKAYAIYSGVEEGKVDASVKSGTTTSPMRALCSQLRHRGQTYYINEPACRVLLNRISRVLRTAPSRFRAVRRQTKDGRTPIQRNLESDIQQIADGAGYVRGRRTDQAQHAEPCRFPTDEETTPIATYTDISPI